MKILVIYHSQTGHAQAMAQAAAQGADRVEGAEAVLKPAVRAGLEDLLACRGLVIATPEYFGYPAGLVKDFFDRVYLPAQAHQAALLKKPYTVLVSAGNDGSGAAAHLDRLCLGFRLKKVQETLIRRGHLSPEDLEACRELGEAMAAGCEMGIF